MRTTQNDKQVIHKKGEKVPTISIGKRKNIPLPEAVRVLKSRTAQNG